MIRRRETLIGMGAAGLAACTPAGGKMQFSQDGLSKLEATLKDHLAKGSAPGLVALVSRGGETHAWPMGRMSLAPDAAPVPRDAIVRIASMTKPVTAAVAMMLVEEGKLKLDEPVDRLAPELANRRVLKRLDAPLDETVPAKRPITLEDVLTFRLGWGIDFADTPFTRAAAGIEGFGMPNPASEVGPDEFMRRLGALPLQAQPGERWLYTLGSNVLGVLIARAEGKPLDVVFQERLLGPLGMADTAFWVPPEKQLRLITGYMPKDGKLVPFEPWNGMYAKPPVFPAGDSGLVSTADDYAKLGRFLQTGLAADGKRLLTEASLKAMETDRLTPAQRALGKGILVGRGWGYGMSVIAEPDPYGRPLGAYGWDGGFGTTWFNEPQSGLIAVLLTQRVFDGPDPPALVKDFWRTAHAAVA
jgi:CubicO group peptidase (beta-lactamase class C family)